MVYRYSLTIFVFYFVCIHLKLFCLTEQFQQGGFWTRLQSPGQVCLGQLTLKSQAIFCCVFDSHYLSACKMSFSFGSFRKRSRRSSLQPDERPALEFLKKFGRRRRASVPAKPTEVTVSINKLNYTTVLLGN